MGLEVLHIVKERKAKRAVVKGIKRMDSAVGSTLGPLGKTAGLATGWAAPSLTKDGVTVARAVELRDAVENVGAQAVRQAAIAANNSTGDGTTTATVLAYHMVKAGVAATAKKMFSTPNRPSEIQRGMTAAANDVSTALYDRARDIENTSQIKYVVQVSSNNDADITDAMVSASDEIGKHGLMLSSTTLDNEKIGVDITDGIQVPAGMASSLFINDKKTSATEMMMPHIVIYQGDIRKSTVLNVFMHWLEKQRSKSAILIADKFTGDSMDWLMMAKQTAGISFDVLPIARPNNVPNWGEIMEDLSAFTGAKIIKEDSNEFFDSITDESWGSYCGTATKASITTTSLNVIGKGASEESVEKRVNEIKNDIEKADTSPEERRALETRLAVFLGKTAMFRVGGETPIEAKERKDRLDDSIGALKHAVKLGVVAGGGVALYDEAERARKAFQSTPSPSYDLGYSIVLDACRQPFMRIVSNSGRNGNAYLKLLDKFRKEDADIGCDVKTGEFGDMFHCGVIDPVSVVATSLKSAASVAGTLTTLGCVMVRGEEQSWLSKMFPSANQQPPAMMMPPQDPMM